jgi:hypothetical protein
MMLINENIKYARYDKFMYLLYNLLQLRRASLRKTLYVKRHVYQSSLKDLKNLTTSDLQKASKRVQNHLSIKNSIISRFLKNIIVIETFVSHSYNEKLKMRAQIKDIIIRYDLSTFWITLNSFDLHNSLILKLIEEFISLNIESSTYINIKNKTAIFNLVMIAQFFNIVYQVFFDAFLVSKIIEMKILDRIVAHYAVTKTNEREMFHFHKLVWLIDNTEFLIIRDRIRSDSDFSKRMIEYLKSIIKQNLQNDLSKLSNSSLSSVWKNSKNIIDDDAFMNLLNVDANHVTIKKNMHKYNATYHKYDHKECKFNFSRFLQQYNKVDEHEIIHLKKIIFMWMRLISSSNHVFDLIMIFNEFRSTLKH